MSEVTTYKKGEFSQINLSDGNKILLSYGATDMRIFKLGFLSIPKETIYIFDSSFLYKLTQKIGYDLSKDIVQILAKELASGNSIEEVKQICSQIENDKNFLENI